MAVLYETNGREAIETYAQALTWLGADESTPDEFILSMLALKVSLCSLSTSTSPSQHPFS
jgi:hypothetical protein